MEENETLKTTEGQKRECARESDRMSEWCVGSQRNNRNLSVCLSCHSVWLGRRDVSAQSEWRRLKRKETTEGRNEQWGQVSFQVRTY